MSAIDPSDKPSWPCEGKAWTFLAPMEGITHPAFRSLIARRPGVGVVCTEFVRIAAVPAGDRYLRRQVVASPGAALSVQVMGNHVQHLAEATASVARAGADIVDLNVGCPAPRAVRKGVGSALLKDPELLARVVSAMRASTGGFLSAKMRAGFDNAARAVELARILEDCGVNLIAVHPRRRVDFYQGVADWRIIAAIKSAVSIPVIGNGDVWYAEDALRMRRETGCDGVMIGRGALRNPWIFEQIEALKRQRPATSPTGEDVLGHFDALADLLSEAYPRGVLGMLKEQTRYLGRALPGSQLFIKLALRCSSVAELRLAFARVLETSSEVALDLGVSGGVEGRTSERSGGTGATQASP